MYEGASVYKRWEAEYIKLTLSVFFQHQPHKHKFPFFKKKTLPQKGILNYLRPVFWGYIPNKCQNLQFNKWEIVLYPETFKGKYLLPGWMGSLRRNQLKTDRGSTGGFLQKSIYCWSYLSIGFCCKVRGQLTWMKMALRYNEIILNNWDILYLKDS